MTGDVTPKFYAVDFLLFVKINNLEMYDSQDERYTLYILLFEQNTEKFGQGLLPLIYSAAPFLQLVHAHRLYQPNHLQIRQNEE